MSLSLFYDDWGDGSLTGRMDQWTGLLVGDDGVKHKAVHRPDWTAESGSPSAGSGYLSLPDGSTTFQEASAPSDVTAGVFKATFAVQSSVSSGTFTFDFASNAANDEQVYVEHLSDGTLRVRRMVGGSAGTVFSSTWPADTATHTTTVRWSPDGSLKLLFDGANKGSDSHVTLHFPVERVFFGSTLDAEVRVSEVDIR